MSDSDAMVVANMVHNSAVPIVDWKDAQMSSLEEEGVTFLSPSLDGNITTNTTTITTAISMGQQYSTIPNMICFCLRFL